MHKEPERNPRKVLGKGLSALLPQRQAPTPEQPPTPAATAATPAKPVLPENFEEFQKFRWTKSSLAKSSRATFSTTTKSVSFRNRSVYMECCSRLLSIATRKTVPDYRWGETLAGGTTGRLGRDSGAGADGGPG